LGVGGGCCKRDSAEESFLKKQFWVKRGVLAGKSVKTGVMKNNYSTEKERKKKKDLPGGKKEKGVH